MIHPTSRLRALFFSLSIVMACAFHSGTALGQGIPSGGGGGGGERSDKDFQFVPVPYIDYNRSLGLSIGALPMAMYNLSSADTLSPSSISGALGMYSTNESWFGLIFNKFHFSEDRWRVTAAGGVGNINFQFYLTNPIPGPIGYNTAANFAFGEVQRKTVGNLYLGANYMYTKFQTSFDTAIPVDSTSTHNGIGLVASYDARDDVYYPRDGYVTSVNFRSQPEWLGNDFVSDKIEIDHNHYFAVRDTSQVIAARFFGGFGIGDLSFNQQFIIGNTDIRGYSQGEFRGNQMMAAQAEYRWTFYKKLGAVGFVGVATVLEALNEDHDGVLRPAVGGGLRYMIFPKQKMNVGMDAAAGDGDWGIYFRVGEAF